MLGAGSPVELANGVSEDFRRGFIGAALCAGGERASKGTQTRVKAPASDERFGQFQRSRTSGVGTVSRIGHRPEGVRGHGERGGMRSGAVDYRHWGLQ